MYIIHKMLLDIFLILLMVGNTPENWGTRIFTATNPESSAPQFTQSDGVKGIFRLGDLVGTMVNLWKIYERNGHTQFPVIKDIMGVADLQILNNSVAVIEHPADDLQSLGALEAYWIGDARCNWDFLRDEFAKQWTTSGTVIPQIPDEFWESIKTETLISPILSQHGKSPEEVNIFTTSEHLWVTAGGNPEYGISQIVTIDFTPPKDVWEGNDEANKLSRLLGTMVETDTFGSLHNKVATSANAISFGMTTVYNVKGNKKYSVCTRLN